MRKTHTKSEGTMERAEHLAVHPRVFALVALIPISVAIFLHHTFVAGATPFGVWLLLVGLAFSFGFFRFLALRSEHESSRVSSFVDGLIALLWGLAAYFVFSIVEIEVAGLAYSSHLLSFSCSAVIYILLVYRRFGLPLVGCFFAFVSVLMLLSVSWRSSHEWIHQSAVMGEDFSGDPIAGVSTERAQWFAGMAAKSLTTKYSEPIDKQPKPWSYDGATGPSNWGSLSAEFSKCGSGKWQSPIDIPRKAAKSKNAIRFKWASETMAVDRKRPSGEVSWSGRSKASLNGETYAVKKTVFHSPSEHQINGFSYPMEMQLYLESPSGRVAILGVFVEIGASHKEFDKIISQFSLPAEAPPVVNQVSARDLLPATFDHYKYEGSLTMPPCTEGVSWYVLDHSVEVSASQLAQLRSKVGQNARPVQALGSRSFEASEALLSH